MGAVAYDERMFDPSKVSDLIEELRGKNHVRVMKFKKVDAPHQRTLMKKVEDEVFTNGVPTLHGMMLHDSVRCLHGLKPIYVPELLRRIGGELRSITPNLRTNVGADFAAAQLGGTSVAVADYIGLANNTITPAATDASSTHPWDTAQAADAAPSGTTGEYTALGVARKQATYAHTGGTATYTQSATWTATGTVTSLRLAGLFGGSAKTTQGNSANNILFLENTFTATSLANGDQLSLTWTISV